MLREPNAEAAKCLAHEFKHKACMGAVWALMLKIIDKVTNIVVAQLVTTPISKMGENLLLKGVVSLAVAYRAQHLQCPKSAWFIAAGAKC